VLTGAAPLAGAIHLAFSGLFEWLGASQLAFGNLAFVALWGAIHWLLKQRKNHLAVALVWIAIPAHSLVATKVLGWDCGFHYYTLVMVPVMFISPGGRSLWKVVLGVVLTAFYIALDCQSRQQAPIVTLTPSVLAWVRGFNMASTIGVLAYLAHLYFGVVGAAESQLRALATTDVLTGLANRRRILDVANYEIMRGRRDGTPLSFVLGDVDHFKRVNDGSGHETGDQVLVTLAGVLRSVVREVDTVARWGGEEFLIVLPDTTLDAAFRVAERARWSIECASWPMDQRVTMTLGVSQLRDGETLAEAVARADEALYRGQARGPQPQRAGAAGGSAELVAEFRGAPLSRLDGLHEGRFHVARFERRECRVGGASLRRHPFAQHQRRLVRCEGQGRRPGKRGERELLALLGREPHLLGGLHHGLHDVEHVRRARAREGRDGVEVVFAVYPERASRGGEQAFGVAAFDRGDRGAGVEAGDALADQCGGVGHGTHDPLGAEGGHQCVAADAGHHAELQRLADVGAGGRCGLLEDLRFHGPDHHVGALQHRPGRFERDDAEVALQHRTLVGVGFEHEDVGGRFAALEEAADDGAGHVAAAYERNEHDVGPPVASLLPPRGATGRPAKPDSRVA
jgi:diguanylate cyclase (GGDEF)-like protein